MHVCCGEGCQWSTTNYVYCGRNLLVEQSISNRETPFAGQRPPGGGGGGGGAIGPTSKEGV